MFWRKEKNPSNTVSADLELFESAKEATCRATLFARIAARTMDKEGQELMQLQFQMCRSAAISAGAQLRQSKVEVDKAISAQVEAAGNYLGSASNEEIMAYAKEASEIVRAFLVRAKLIT